MFPLNTALIEERLGLKFSQPDLWHYVFFDETPDGSPPPDHLGRQLLAYRGDKVIDLVIGDHFADTYPEHRSQHGLWRSGLASNKAFRSILEDRGVLAVVRQTLHPKLIHGIKEGGTMFEAAVGAYYKVAGLESVQDYLYQVLLPLIPSVIEQAWAANPAMRLQAICSTLFRSAPDFTSLGLAGSRQRQAYAVRLVIPRVLKIDGYGRTTEAAKERAISDAFDILRRRGIDVDAPPLLVLSMTARTS